MEDQTPSTSASSSSSLFPEDEEEKEEDEDEEGQKEKLKKEKTGSEGDAEDDEMKGKEKEDDEGERVPTQTPRNVNQIQTKREVIGLEEPIAAPPLDPLDVQRMRDEMEEHLMLLRQDPSRLEEVSFFLFLSFPFFLTNSDFLFVGSNCLGELQGTHNKIVSRFV